MLTYQDLLLVDERDEYKRINFVRSAIEDHKAGELYKTAVLADEYDRHKNRTILQYQKTLRLLSGKQVPDTWSPNWKITSNFFNRFVTQENQYLLGNGVSWKNSDTESKLGDDFDTKLQEAGKKALVQGEAFGFYNNGRMDVFGLMDFAPLYDEVSGALMAGVRFWQVDSLKPLRATLYELDGITEFAWGVKDANGVLHDGGIILAPKRPYKIKVRESVVDGIEIYDGENYPSFPIVPLWGNPHHQSEIVGIQSQIDAYDMIKSGFTNDLDTAQIFWIIQGAGGMDDLDMAKFLERLRMLKIADVEDGQEVKPVTVDIPYEARQQLLDRLERDLYKDYMALNVDEIKGGAVTATQILAAYEPLNTKTDQFEYCVVQFLQGILTVAGIEDKPTFTRSRVINASEEVQTLLQAEEVLDDEYVTRKILDIFGDGDMADEVLKRKDAEDMERMADFGGKNGNDKPISENLTNG